MTEHSDSGEEQPDTFAEQRLDMDALLQDFADYLREPAEERANSRGDRVALNLVHMVMAIATQGVYLFLYLGYYVYRFFKENPLDTYKVECEVEVKKIEDEGQEEVE